LPSKKFHLRDGIEATIIGICDKRIYEWVRDPPTLSGLILPAWLPLPLV
jgi:hypothetical protein